MTFTQKMHEIADIKIDEKLQIIVKNHEKQLIKLLYTERKFTKLSQENPNLWTHKGLESDIFRILKKKGVIYYMNNCMSLWIDTKCRQCDIF